MALNPYTPGAGLRPALLAGRSSQLALLTNVADQLEDGRAAETLVCTGLRGMGKTVLLQIFAERLRERGWLCGYYEARRDVDPGVAVATIVVESSRQLRSRRLRQLLGALVARVGAASITMGPAGLRLEVRSDATSEDPYLALKDLLVRIGQAARADHVGSAFLVDELQVFKKRDLSILIQASQAVLELPVALIGAGLPYLPAELSKANTYAERFRYEVIDALAEPDARAVVVEPAADLGVSVEDDAVTEILARSKGYPYFLQLYSAMAWEEAGFPSRGGTVSLGHLQAALPAIERRIDNGLYAARYDRATPIERSYLKAMAFLGDDRIVSGDVARHLGRPSTGVGPIRDRLIRKGLIHSPANNVLDFSVPGFAAYVRRRSEWED